MTTFLRQVRNLAAVVALASISLLAQTGLGIVTGTVKDSSNAAVANASITLTNTATGVSKTSQTNSSGIYSFESVPIGPYSLSAQATGFEKWSGTFEVPAGQTVTIDPTLN